MIISFRWFGPADPVPLAYVRQIPGVRGVVSAVYDVPVGEVWPRHKLDRLAGDVADAGLELSVIEIVDRPANGVTFCTGSLGVHPANDLPAMIRDLGGRRRIHFMHCRNVRRTGDKRFEESPHPSAFGDVDMFAVIDALLDVGFEGPMRPDHGRMIWGETGRPGYVLHDRALGATYLEGLWEGASRSRRPASHPRAGARHTGSP